MDNTHIRSSFYTVYSQPDISRGVCDSWRQLKFKLFYSPPFFPAWLRMAIAAVIYSADCLDLGAGNRLPALCNQRRQTILDANYVLLDQIDKRGFVITPW